MSADRPGAGYRFVPFVRSGFRPDETFDEDRPASDPLTGPVTFGVSLTVEGRRKADGISEPADDDPARTVRMYGPGDVSGIDTRQIVRTEPAANTTNVPPTSFPAVEFDRPDLPWLFSPERADDAGRTTPWLCLVVVADDRDDVSLVRSTDGERSVLTAPGSELPPAEETWAWAHAQVIGPGSIDDVVARDSTRTRSRLLCPRRLDPETDYIAAVVPTFEPGRLAGLGQSPYRTDETGEPTGSGEIGRAWDGTESAVELPVYHHWTFQTGPDGDFETLVDRLTPRDLPADVGIRTVDVSRPGPDSLEPGRTDGPDPDASVVDVTGALASPESQLLPESEVLASYSDTQRERLRSILNRPNAAGVDPTVPVVGPPMYGSFHAGVSAVAESPQWLTGLNLEPRYRIAAGLGAAVVRENQEALMAAAWEQAGELEQLNQVLGGGQVGRAGAGRIYERLKSASLSRLLQFTAPAHDQVVPDPDETATDRRTLAARIDDNDALATGVFRPTFRRVTRPKGTLGRAASITARPTAFAEDFVTGTATTDDLADRLEDRLYSVDDLADASLSPTTDGRGAPDLSSLSGTEAAFDPERAIPDVVLSRVSDATALHDRPDPLATVLWAPTFGEPLSRALADLSEEHLLPDVGDIPADTVGALATSPAFVESFLAGANHEMARELLWRRFPTDRRGTYFTTFWNRAGDPFADGSGDVGPITEWGDRPLGAAVGGTDTVIVVRGELLRRYPETVIYAVKATGTAEAPTPALSALESVDPDDGPEESLAFPRFRGRLSPDVTFLGFDITPSEATGETPTAAADGSGDDDLGWFFVFEEPMGETRFGLDTDVDGADVGTVPPGVTTDGPEPTGSTAGESGWDALSWGHVTPNGSQPADTQFLRIRDGLPDAGSWRIEGHGDDAATWGHNSAHMARITWQRPVRVCIHAADLLPTDDT